MSLVDAFRVAVPRDAPPGRRETGRAGGPSYGLYRFHSTTLSAGNVITAGSGGNGGSGGTPNGNNGATGAAVNIC